MVWSAAFFEINVSKKSFRNTTGVSNSLDQDQNRHVDRPDLGSNCFRMLEAGGTGMHIYSVTIISFLASVDFCRPLITFATILDQDQTVLILIRIVWHSHGVSDFFFFFFLEKFILKKVSWRQQKYEQLSAMQRVKMNIMDHPNFIVSEYRWTRPSDGKGLLNPLYTENLTNSEDPDEMPHNAAFHLGLHNLSR